LLKILESSSSVLKRFLFPSLKLLCCANISSHLSFYIYYYSLEFNDREEMTTTTTTFRTSSFSAATAAAAAGTTTCSRRPSRRCRRNISPTTRRRLISFSSSETKAALADQQPSQSSSAAKQTSSPLSYELVQGALVKYTVEEKKGPHPPTCVFLHGILGSRRNLLSFAKRMAEEMPSWQFLLVDLRCHGQTNTESTESGERRFGEDSVESAARDVIETLQSLKFYPHMLVGHSFGGKVAMSMVHQFSQGERNKVLPRPVQVWVLDTVPGDAWARTGDHPKDTINFVRTLDTPFASRKHLVDSLTGAGFTIEGAQWMTTNLKPAKDGNKGELDWVFDLDGIKDMYSSYEATNLWPMLETQPKGLEVDFVRAERSAFVWAEEDVNRLLNTGARIHFLENSSHWVHIDNPNSLLNIMKPSFESFNRRR
tara:strand:- start:440 stop:1717 length:1278 start_codon:yes stop_codon:yes gene_type:complete